MHRSGAALLADTRGYASAAGAIGSAAPTWRLDRRRGVRGALRPRQGPGVDSEVGTGGENVTNPRWTCLNCDRSFASSKAKLFCAELCRDVARLVRYVRACRADGRADQPDVQDAIRIQLAHVLAGGYPRLRRQVPLNIRALVIARDEGRCQVCGGVGTEIDHIDGSSNELENLQLLCHDCHVEKTKSRLRVILPMDQRYSEYAKKAAELKRRFEARKPLRLCDDHERWNGASRVLLAERRAQLGRRAADE